MGSITKARIRPYAAGFCALVLAVGLSILERLDSALSAMHRAGDVAAGIGSVATPAALWGVGSAQEAMRAWWDWDSDQLASDGAGHVLTARDAVIGFSIIDTVGVAFPLALLLWLLGGWAREVIRTRAVNPSRLRKRPPAQRHDSMMRVRALCQVASMAPLTALIYLAFDVLENAMAVYLIGFSQGDAVAVWLLGLLSLFKWLALAAAALPLLLILIAVREDAGHMIRTVARWLMALRAQLVVIVVATVTFLAVGGDIGTQVDDVVMRWAEQPEHGVSAIVVALVLTVLLALTGFTCVAHYAEPPDPVKNPLTPRLLFLLFLGGLALAGAGLAAALVWGQGWGYMLVFPGGAVALFALLSTRKAVRAVKPPPRDLAVSTTVPVVLIWALAAMPLAALGMVVVRSAVTLAVTREGYQDFAWLGLGLIFVAAVAVAWHPVPPGPALVWQIVLIGLSVAAVLAAAYGAARPAVLGDGIGTVAVLLLLEIILLLIFTALHLLGDAWAPRGALAMLRLRRTPLIILAISWFAITSLIDRTTHYHDVRLGDPLPQDFKAFRVDEAFDAWMKLQHTGPVENGRQRIPMIFIATAGGGIRSAYWTGLILDCLFSPSPADKQCEGQPIDETAVFAASGISGGSLGLVLDRAVADAGGEVKVTDVLERDYLSPDVAAFAFRDLPNYMLRKQSGGSDRAAVMEHAWEDAFGPGDDNPLRSGFFASSRIDDKTPRFPLLMLNSASIEDGCRLNGSTLDASARVTAGPVPPKGTETCLTLSPFEPGRESEGNSAQAEALAGSKDLFQYVCAPQDEPENAAKPGVAAPVRHDIPLSAVAHLSARFPYVSPTGALTSCSWPQRRTYALDGGLLEASAVSPLTELWTRLAGLVHEVNTDPQRTVCIEPRLLMIDNGYAAASSARDGGRPAELIAPASGVSRFNSSWGARAEQAAALAFDHAFASVACRSATGATIAPEGVQSRIAHIVPVARPGPRAPLGWSLSQYARRDLTEQAHSPANMCQVALVRSWIKRDVPRGGTRCLTGFIVRADTTAALDAGPPQPITMVSPILPNALGVPGVKLAISNGETGCAGGTVTDAAGRFQLLVPVHSATDAVEVTVCLNERDRLTVLLPAGDDPVVTSVNFAVVGEGDQAAQEAR
jgi:hypothetical protein